jgi:hypothetical protein
MARSAAPVTDREDELEAVYSVTTLASARE